MVVCTDLSDKNGMGKVIRSGNLGGVMVITMARNAKDVGSIPALGSIFPIFITAHDISEIA